MAGKFSSVEIFVTDLDGTLFLPETEDIPPEFFKKIELWRKAGGLWIVATGRPDERIREFFRNWEQLPDFYIVCERYIFSVDSRGGISPFSKWNNRLRQVSREAEKRWEEFTETIRLWIEGENIEVEIEEGTFVFSEVMEARLGESLLKETLPGGYKPLRNRVHLSVAPDQVGKGRCLVKIIERTDYNSRQVFCVGDSINDLDMLDGRYGFHSGTVASAEEEIKKAVRNNKGIITGQRGGKGPVECLDKLLEAKDSR